MFNTCIKNAIPETCDDDDIEPKLQTPIQQFFRGINPINTEAWRRMRLIRKCFEIFKSPFLFALLLTCPVVDHDVQISQNWNKYLQCVQCVMSPLFISIATGFGFQKLGGHLPLWVLMILIGIPFSGLVYFTSKTTEKPRYHWVFAYVGFLVSLIWTYTIANVIVNVLQTFGIVFNISNAILGITLLAWGNSLGDWIANPALAKHGFARIGFSACFGAPFFNLMLGFSVPMLILMATTGETQVKLVMSPIMMILPAFLIGNLLFNFIFVNITQFKITRIHGVLEICIYLVFLTLALLTETGVMLSDWEQPRKCVVDCMS